MITVRHEITDAKLRVGYLDYLRVIATISVIVLHVTACFFNKVDLCNREWYCLDLISASVRWGVPVFLMISGALFLGREIPTKIIYSKYILRLVISYCVWSLIYTASAEVNFFGHIVLFIKGYYHMWFIPMIIGIYVLMPLIKPIVENNSRTKYYLALALVFAFVLPWLSMIASDFGNESIVNGFNAINRVVENISMKMVLGFVGFFVLGYYLYKTDLSKRIRIIIYAFGLLGFFMTFGLNALVLLKTGQYCQNYFNSFTVNVLLESLSLFVLFKYLKLKPSMIMQHLSKYSFGVYLVHVLIIEQLDKRFIFCALPFHHALSIPCISAIVFVASYAISAGLNHIPVLKKYMV